MQAARLGCVNGNRRGIKKSSREKRAEERDHQIPLSYRKHLPAGLNVNVFMNTTKQRNITESV